MKIRNKLYGISLLSLLLSVAACTGETEEMKTPDPIPSEDVGRRDVLLTLKNQLSIVPTKSGEASTKSGEIQATKAGDEIATAAENKISALDIYVFGCKTEDGVYTYQERFCYRENSSEMPSGSDVTALDLTAKGSEGKETTALLSLKKGLFVKLYCIANQGKLIDPATGAVYTDFVPLFQSNPGQASNTVTDGKPKEVDFKLLQSTQLDPALTTDILLTPLPMTGAYATPLDLTDFSVSARLQLGFRLTRAVARFDVVNDASTSKFTIESVSMANGRKGVSFFPLTVTGKLPDADAGDLITYPARKFDGTDANAGISTGAFYTWPSPVQDGGYLILSGTYAANKTDNVPVTYKIPFKPSGSETGNYIEVSQNHRYTVEITKADEYHLDFTLDVADWTDDGSIDDYEPGGDTDKDGMKVQITDVNGSYDKTTRTVTMAITDDAQFAIEGGSTSGYYTTMYYENMDTEHQWLTMDPPADNITKADAISSIFTIKKNAEYKDTKFPIATIRFTDKITAKETVVIVQPLSKPAILLENHSVGSMYENNVLSLYQTTAITQPMAILNVFASGGSRLGFTDVTVPGQWLVISPALEQDASSANFTFTLNASDKNFPDPYPLEGKTFTIINKEDESMTETITLKLKSDLSETSETKGQAEYDGVTNTLRLYNNTNDKVKLTINSIGGTEIINAPLWLTVTKENADKNKTTYIFNVASNATTGVNSSFQIRSKADNSIIKTYKVLSINTKVTFSTPTKSNNYTTISNFTSTTPTIDYFACSDSYIDFTVNSPKGITVSNDWTKLNILSETTLATGQKETKIRMQTVHDDLWHSSPTSSCTLTVKDKYSSSTQKTITVKQYMIVYPGSKIPPNSLSRNGINWWVAPVNANNGSQMYYTDFNKQKNSVCPSGWKVPSSNDYRNLVSLSSSSTLFQSYNYLGTDFKNQLLKAFPANTYYSSDNQPGPPSYRNGIVIDYWDQFTKTTGVYVDGLGGSNFYIRCVKNK